MPPSLPVRPSYRRKWEQLTDESAVLCRDDLVWLVEFVKHQVAAEDPGLLNLSQARLLRNFHAFAEIASLLIHGPGVNNQETGRIKEWIKEAGYGLSKE